MQKDINEKLNTNEEIDLNLNIKESEVENEKVPDSEIKIPETETFTSKGKGIGKVISQYPYRNEEGKTVFTVNKMKGGSQPYLISHIDKWGNEIHKLPRNEEVVIYNLPEVIQAIENNEVIWIMEGESKCNTLNKLGFTATTCIGNKPSKWNLNYNEFLKNAKRIIIVVDNDEKSEAFAEYTKNSIIYEMDGVKVKILKLNQIYKKLKNGGDIDDLIEKIGEERTKLTLQTIEDSF